MYPYIPLFQISKYAAALFCKSLFCLVSYILISSVHLVR